MKVTFKDLKQQKFTLEIEPSDKISAVKQKIFEEMGWEANLQKLIYSGKILKDDETVESYKIEEKGFVVCMVNRPKPAPAASTEASSSKTPATPTTTAASAAAPAAPAQTSSAAVGNTATPTPTRSAAASRDDPNALTMGQQRDEAIRSIESMGFARPEIDAAMRAAFFNPERAVEYLINGIPNDIQQQQAQPPAHQAAAQPAAALAAAADNAAADAVEDEAAPVNLFDLAAQRQGDGGAGAPHGRDALEGLADLDLLRQDPQFQQLRQVVQQQPQMLEHILQQLGAGNPALAELIQSNPDQFLNLLGERDPNDAPIPPGAQAISVTPEERDAIDRLCGLGFNRDLAIQAYFACDKNEELAANFLFDQPAEDEDNAN